MYILHDIYERKFSTLLIYDTNSKWVQITNICYTLTQTHHIGNKHTSNNRRDHKHTEKGKCFTQTAVTIQIA